MVQGIHHQAYIFAIGVPPRLRQVTERCAVADRTTAARMRWSDKMYNFVLH